MATKFDNAIKTIRAEIDKVPDENTVGMKLAIKKRALNALVDHMQGELEQLKALGGL